MIKIEMGLSSEELAAVDKACAILRLQRQELLWLGLDQVMQAVPGVLADNYLSRAAGERFNHAEMPNWAGKDWELC